MASRSGTHPIVKPGFNRNQFCADFGGAIVKNKLFYFVDYEGFRQTLTPTVVLTVPTQNEINGILAVDVQDPFSPGTYYKVGTSILGTPHASPIAKQILGFFKNLPSQCQIAPGAAGINASTGVDSNDCPANAPFTDNADKGDLRIDFQQSEKSSWFLKVIDRKETGINHPTLPLPLDGQTNGRIKILDRQVALGYTRLVNANKGALTAAECAEVVVGDGARHLGGRGTMLRALFQPTGQRLEDGAHQAAGGNGRVGDEDRIRGQLQRVADLPGLLAENGAADLLQSGAQPGGLDDENARFSRVLGEEQKQRLDGVGNSVHRIGRGGLGLVDDLGHPLAEGFQDRRKDVLLVAEVGVKAAHGAARLGHDHGHGGGVIAVAAEEAGCGAKNRPATGILAGFGGGGFAVGHFWLADLLSRIE